MAPGRIALLLAGCGLWAAGASAQDVEPVDRPATTDNVLVLDNWTYDALYTDGWSVDGVLEKATVADPSGATVGNVDDLVFSDDGTLLAFVAEIDAKWGLAATHVRVPWEEAVLSDDATELRVPISRETIGDYSIFDQLRDEAPPELAEGSRAEIVRPDAASGDDAFRATDLIGDFASVEDQDRFGYVNDIIVRDNRIAALVIMAAGTEAEGPRAYPYAGYRSSVDPESDTRFRLPFTSEEADVIEDFDYDRLIRRSD